jgi:hypothetical protein
MVLFTIDELAILVNILYIPRERSSKMFDNVPQMWVDYTYYRVRYQWWGEPLPPDAIKI